MSHAKPTQELLRYDPSGAFVAGGGSTPAELAELAPRLEAARHEVLNVDLPLYYSQQKPPVPKDPLDAGFIELPERLLAEYDAQREQSELGRILSLADRLREQVDRVVVLGIGGSYMGARALLDACCDSYWNELSRAERGSRPRIYYEGNNVDNDASTGLLRLLGNGRPARTVDERFALVAVSKSGGTLETAVATRQFLKALSGSLENNARLISELFIPVTGFSNSKLNDLAAAYQCREKFPVPDGVGGRFSVFSAVGLLPAAIAGLDVMQLLRGAAAMNAAFKARPLGANPVLDYVAAGHALESKHGCNIRVLAVWAKSLEAVGLWYDQLLAESLGKEQLGATPLTTVNTRDLHSRAQQHQQGKYDKLVTNIIVDNWRCDDLTVGESQHNADKLNDLAKKTLPQLMLAAIAGTNLALRDDGRPTADIHLPTVNVHVLGQLLQMFMLATVVEGRLLGINPYGQPGVEKYKQYMNKNLGR